MNLFAPMSDVKELYLKTKSTHNALKILEIILTNA